MFSGEEVQLRGLVKCRIFMFQLKSIDKAT